MTELLKNKIDIEIQNNRIWKAKEILQSTIASNPYDKEVYCEYAKLIFQLGDFVESGKYFFLTDADDDKYKKAIEEFLKRHTEANIYSQFPRQFKKVSVKDFPKNLNDLISKKPEILGYIKEYQEHLQEPYEETMMDKYFGVIFISAGIVSIIIFAIGALVVIKYLWDLLWS